MKETIQCIKPWEALRKLPQQKVLKIVVVVGLVAVAGIMFSEGFSSTKEQKQESSENEKIDLQEYEKKVEKRLTDILCEVDGIGSCRVMVTVDSSQESVYSMQNDTQSQSSENTDFSAESENRLQSSENSSSSSQKNQYVIVNDDGEKPILEKEIEPKIRGVIVVCEGADDVTVRESVIDCIRAGLGVTSANISVVRGGKKG